MIVRGPWRVLLALALGLGAAGGVSAHELRPGFLELRERDASTYALLWRRRTGGDVEIFIAPVLPGTCTNGHAPRQGISCQGAEPRSLGVSGRFDG